MSFDIATLSAIIPYVSPPVLGAFIGYLTNKVAIKMLFRPLEAKYVGGMRLPMTPGVIPSKRADLAKNIGEMVGTHLLTGEEIQKALEKESFQKTLYALIESRGEKLLGKDLGAVAEIIPEKYSSYYNVAEQAIIDQAQKTIHSFIESESFKQILNDSLDEQFERLLATDVQQFFPGQDRESIYRLVEESLGRMFKSPAMSSWVETFVQQKVYGSLSQEKSFAQLIPEELQHTIITSIEQQTPHLLAKLASILAEPEIREKVVVGVRKGVESFVASLGPMAVMVAGFLTPEVVEGKVRDYLVAKEEEIVDALKSEEIQQRVASTLRDRSQAFLNTPLSTIIGENQDEMVENVCTRLSEQLLALLQEPETTTAFASMVKDNVETHIDGGKLALGEVLFDFVGEEGVERAKQWGRDEIAHFLQSEKTRKTVNSMVENLLSNLLARPIGRLARLLPAGVREGMYTSLQKISSNMLAAEVPGLVNSLNIQKIVKDKVDSLDLLRLEGLLLSIMEEQFKYINLFGALLGFIIGCLNLFFIRVL